MCGCRSVCCARCRCMLCEMRAEAACVAVALGRGCDMLRTFGFQAEIMVAAEIAEMCGNNQGLVKDVQPGSDELRRPTTRRSRPSSARR